MNRPTASISRKIARQATRRLGSVKDTRLHVAHSSDLQLIERSMVLTPLAVAIGPCVNGTGKRVTGGATGGDNRYSHDRIFSVLSSDSDSSSSSIAALASGEHGRTRESVVSVGEDGTLEHETKLWTSNFVSVGLGWEGEGGVLKLHYVRQHVKRVIRLTVIGGVMVVVILYVRLCLV